MDVSEVSKVKMYRLMPIRAGVSPNDICRYSNAETKRDQPSSGGRDQTLDCGLKQGHMHWLADFLGVFYAILGAHVKK